MGNRDLLKTARTWVIKIGSSLLTDNGRGLNLDSIARWGQQICQLQDQGLDVVLAHVHLDALGCAQRIARAAPRQWNTARSKTPVATTSAR
jgi:glutamate 5-kinase